MDLDILHRGDLTYSNFSVNQTDWGDSSHFTGRRLKSPSQPGAQLGRELQSVDPRACARRGPKTVGRQWRKGGVDVA